MNLSETAFPDLPDERGLRRLRWFTPTTEVPLCGHATLASAHALFEAGVEETPLRFDSRSGPLSVEPGPDGALSMDFPADPPASARPPRGLLEVLGAPREAAFLRGRHCALVRIGDEAILRALAPDVPALGRSPRPAGVRGVTLAAPGARPGRDFVSRFFAPWVGVDEDPVTGMAHTVLTPYWSAELGKEEMEARQRSPRGGELRVRLAGDRVILMGNAVTVAQGVLRLPD
jgi:PhzF family phenazine biosynthesis protein